MTGRSILFLLFGSLVAVSAKPQAAGLAAAGEFKATYGETYVQRDSGPLKADIYLPQGDGPFPGVLVVHGGAWRMGTRGQLSGVAQMLAFFTETPEGWRARDDLRSAVRYEVHNVLHPAPYPGRFDLIRMVAVIEDAATCHFTYVVPRR